MAERKRKIKKVKKKKHKWLLYVSLAVVLLGVIIGSYALYEFKFKTYDVADEAVDEIVEDDYVIKLPDGTEIRVDENGEVIEQEQSSISSNAMVFNSDDSTSSDTDASTGVSSKDSGAESEGGQAAEGTPTSGSTSTGNTSTGNTSTTTDSPNTIGSVTETEKPTVKSIKAKYTPTLQSLQSDAQSRLNGLIANAKSEFATKRANGESISIGYFYNKYMGAADSLEANTDAAFNSVISVIEKDLETNGFDKSHSQSLREEYEASKKALRESLLSEVKGAL
ncbi:hypothetical protein [Ureibacillus aquaedulcis]|uniref:Uncharacterized protein n=1 Tax=Ureibacillus aquaedulcis TaxID=3058421 RepID=A0ABT8GUS1_9BACL|nr:hypothetical protein [Ureibacillus sp. BA0131]MDN4495156.1 hypothetical protein [Ureibacillus sp. BA0131]